MNPAVTTLRRIRGERRPEDSGEWRPVATSFKFLTNRTPMLRGTERAQTIVATVLAWCGHSAVFHAACTYVDSPLPLVIPGSMLGTCVGLLWIAQFRELKRTEAVRLAFLWSAVLVIPGLVCSIVLCCQALVGIAFGVAIIVAMFTAFWCGLGVVSALAVHALVGGRP